jgi:molybdenum cofactor cytidylyltransferase
VSGRRGKPPEVPPRAFAIIPAAGESRRMGGVAKLLLPLQGVPLIAHALAAWQAAGISPLVVVRRGDQQLADVCRSYGAEVLTPEIPPPEMKVSVQLALRHLQERYRPAANFTWLLAPADMPRLSSAIIERLLAEHATAAAKANPIAEILVPTIFDKPGHPVLFPWSFTKQVFELATNEGVKALLTRNPVREIDCDDLVGAGSDAFCDVDTPVDYQRLR